MKTIGPNLWLVVNEQKQLAEARMGEIRPDNALHTVFAEMDKVHRHRFKFMCMSPYTSPNPERFRFDVA